MLLYLFWLRSVLAFGERLPGYENQSVGRSMRSFRGLQALAEGVQGQARHVTTLPKTHGSESADAGCLSCRAATTSQPRHRQYVHAFLGLKSCKRIANASMTNAIRCSSRVPGSEAHQRTWIMALVISPRTVAAPPQTGSERSPPGPSGCLESQRLATGHATRVNDALPLRVRYSTMRGPAGTVTSSRPTICGAREPCQAQPVVPGYMAAQERRVTAGAASGAPGLQGCSPLAGDTDAGGSRPLRKPPAEKN